MFATLAEQRGIEAMDAMLAQMAKTQNNEEFLANIAKSIQS